MDQTVISPKEVSDQPSLCLLVVEVMIPAEAAVAAQPAGLQTSEPLPSADTAQVRHGETDSVEKRDYLTRRNFHFYICVETVQMTTKRSVINTQHI